MPAEVHVKVGETVRLSIIAEDKEHGVRIKPVAEGSAPGTPAGLEIASAENCVKFKKHETGVIEFTARTPGTYEFECCKLCGFGHGKMKGQIVVDPSNVHIAKRRVSNCASPFMPTHRFSRRRALSQSGAASLCALCNACAP